MASQISRFNATTTASPTTTTTPAKPVDVAARASRTGPTGSAAADAVLSPQTEAPRGISTSNIIPGAQWIGQLRPDLLAALGYSALKAQHPELPATASIECTATNNGGLLVRSGQYEHTIPAQELTQAANSAGALANAVRIAEIARGLAARVAQGFPCVAVEAPGGRLLTEVTNELPSRHTQTADEVLEERGVLGLPPIGTETPFFAKLWVYSGNDVAEFWAALCPSDVAALRAETSVTDRLNAFVEHHKSSTPSRKVMDDLITLLGQKYGVTMSMASEPIRARGASATEDFNIVRNAYPVSLENPTDSNDKSIINVGGDALNFNDKPPFERIVEKLRTELEKFTHGRDLGLVDLCVADMASDLNGGGASGRVNVADMLTADVQVRPQARLQTSLEVFLADNGNKTALSKENLDLLSRAIEGDSGIELHWSSHPTAVTRSGAPSYDTSFMRPAQDPAMHTVYSVYVVKKGSPIGGAVKISFDSNTTLDDVARVLTRGLNERI